VGWSFIVPRTPGSIYFPFTAHRSSLGQVTEWDAETADGSVIRGLCERILGMEDSHIPRKGERGEAETFWVAVDATELRWAAWPIVNGQVVENDCKGTSREGLDQD